MRLRETSLDDEEARQKLFQTIIGAVSFEENFLILLAHERYDVPFKAKDGAKLDDGSEVFSYFVCAVCPVKPGRELLSYIAEEKTFHNRSAGWAAGMPEAGFLFPAFDGRRTNLYNCLFYTHSSGADNQPLIDALFHVQPPMPADEQRDTFSGVLRNALDDECSLAVVQQVRQEIKDRIDAWQEAKSDDPLVVSGDELKDVLESCGVSEDKRMQFGAQFDESFGGGAVLNPRNLIDVKSALSRRRMCPSPSTPSGPISSRRARSAASDTSSSRPTRASSSTASIWRKRLSRPPHGLASPFSRAFENRRNPLRSI